MAEQPLTAEPARQRMGDRRKYRVRDEIDGGEYDDKGLPDTVQMRFLRGIKTRTGQRFHAEFSSRGATGTEQFSAPRLAIREPEPAPAAKGARKACGKLFLSCEAVHTRTAVQGLPNHMQY